MHGNVFVTAISRNAIVRINAADMSQDTVAYRNPVPVVADIPLDAPVNLAFGTGKGERQSLFISNMGILNYMVPLPEPLKWPGPGLVKIDVGVPGNPLP